MKQNEVLDEIISHYKLSYNKLANELGLKRAQNLYDIRDGKTGISKKLAIQIEKWHPEINKLWLLTGEGQMLTGNTAPNNSGSGKLIPFYDDVMTIGGVNENVTDTKGISPPTDYIDTGDWFRDATAAIRHYGDSMTEYPPGCILALKEVREKQLVIWGKDYVIETNEYRITKRIQRGKTEEYIRAYSSNTETYPDGQLIHEYLDIAWKDIRRIFLVLGYVVKQNGGTIVFSNQHD
jgi:hypothetical protein